ncbi:hypothetical protein FB451DRAFT_1401163 [Mycena latifolia]|nr:hypothetical protein FB451DRAFT_1401163 [Mycena latifolia]
MLTALRIARAYCSLLLSAGQALRPPSAFRTLARSTGLIETPRRTVPATAPDEQPSTVLDAVSTAAMCRAAALTARTGCTGMRRDREPWAHRSSSAPVTTCIMLLHGAATRHFIEIGTTHAGRFMSGSMSQSPH